MNPLNLSLVAVLLFCASTARAQDIADTPENRKQQAERYLDATPPRALFQEMANKDAANVLPTDQQKYKEAFMAQVDVGGVRAALVEALVRHFTAGEMKALADFYGSPVGKSAMAKLSAYMSDVAPTIEVQMRRAQEAGNQSLLEK